MTTIVEQMTMTTPQPIMAKQYLHPHDTTVGSAERLAGRVLQVLGSSGSIVVDFSGIRGISSSYFNVLFRVVGESVGIGRMSQDLVLHYESDTQREIGTRSWDAVISLLRTQVDTDEVS